MSLHTGLAQSTASTFRERPTSLFSIGKTLMLLFKLIKLSEGKIACCLPATAKKTFAARLRLRQTSANKV